MKYLGEHVLTDKPFQFSPDLLRKLASDRWSHWGAEPGRADFPLFERILAIQEIALNQLLAGATLSRVQTQAAEVGKEEPPLTVAEIFRSLSDAVWADLPGANKAEKPAAGSTVLRRNLQRSYLRRLVDLAIGRAGGPPDARSLARLHLREVIRRVDSALEDKGLDDTVRAHLEDVKETASKALNANVSLGVP